MPKATTLCASQLDLPFVNTEKPHKYRFGPFLLDPSEEKLLRDGETVTLTPKAFEALVLLV
jgi:DNA-binding winged helix-turn-helix (wHTH) protein